VHLNTPGPARYAILLPVLCISINPRIRPSIHRVQPFGPSPVCYPVPVLCISINPVSAPPSTGCNPSGPAQYAILYRCCASQSIRYPPLHPQGATHAVRGRLRGAKHVSLEGDPLGHRPSAIGHPQATAHPSLHPYMPPPTPPAPPALPSARQARGHVTSRQACGHVTSSMPRPGSMPRPSGAAAASSTAATAGTTRRRAAAAPTAAAAAAATCCCC